MRIKIGKWSLCIEWRENAEMDHYCLNQIMDGTYDCKYCYPNGDDFWQPNRKEKIRWCASTRYGDSDVKTTSSGGEKK